MKSVDELTNEEITNYLTGKKNKRSYTVTGLQQEAAGMTQTQDTQPNNIDNYISNRNNIE